jgi:hypothetical protein
MKPYAKVDVSEAQLEDLVRRNVGKIEEGLTYVDHQKSAAGGRLDVLMVDSGKSLVVAELKVIQDDGMLMQGLDYYDHVSTQAEPYARLYKAYSIDPTQQVRLFLVAPDFSQTLVNRCKWLDLPISLFTFTCLKFEGEADLIPIFIEREITESPKIPVGSRLSLRRHEEAGLRHSRQRATQRLPRQTERRLGTRCRLLPDSRTQKALRFQKTELNCCSDFRTLLR